jgi:RTX calcium-binding nonapeptide repeat (4 copies)/FG-GAP-like repeat/FG-GAP repeat
MLKSRFGWLKSRVSRNSRTAIRKQRRRHTRTVLGLQALENRNLLAADLTLFETGLAEALGGIQREVTQDVLGKDLPLVGSALNQVADAAIVNGVRSLLNTASNNTIAGITSELQGQLGSILQNFSTSNTDADNTITFDVRLGTSKTFDVPFNSGFSALGLSTTGNVHVTLGFTLDTRIGVDTTGFFVDTGYRTGFDTPELVVSVVVTATGLTGTGNFGLLKAQVTDQGSRLEGSFKVDLVDADNRLRANAGDIASLDAQSRFTSTDSGIQLGLEAEFGAGSINPRLSADFVASWNFTGSDPEGALSSFGNVPTIAVNNVGISAGTLFSSLISPIVEKFSGIADPFVDIVDGLNKKVFPNQDIIPLTYLDVLKLANNSSGDTSQNIGDIGGAGAQSILSSYGVGAGKNESFAFLDLVLKVSSLWKAAREAAATGEIPLGSFTISDPRGATPGLPLQLLGSLPNSGAFGQLKSMASSFFALADQFKTANQSSSGGSFSLDILEDTNNAFKLFLGDKSAQVLTFKLPDLDEGFYKSFSANFLLFGVPITIGYRAGVTFQGSLEGGYDGAGLAKFRSSGQAVDILDGFYLNNDRPFLVLTGRDATNQPSEKIVEAYLGVAGFSKSLAVSLDLDFGIDFGLSVDGRGYLLGVEGGLTGAPTNANNRGIEFAFDDPTPGDNKLRFSDIGHSVEEGLECLFDVSGGVDYNISVKTALEIDFEVRVEVEFSTPFGDVGFRIEIEIETTPVNITWAGDAGNLFSTDFRCDDDSTSGQFQDPRLATLFPDGTLVLHTGVNRSFRNVAQDEINETFLVRHENGTPGDTAGETVRVMAFGASQTFTGVRNIFADGGDGNDVIEITPQVQSPAYIEGGIGDDRLYLGQGGGSLYGDIGNDQLFGGTALDQLFGEEGDDQLFGGEGPDILRGGDNDDLMQGDEGDDTFIGGNGNDRMFGGGGVDRLFESGDVHFSLTNSSLEGLGSDSLSGIETAFLNGGTSDNAFNVSAWTGTAYLNAEGGNDLYGVTLNPSGSGLVIISDDSGTADLLTVKGTTTVDHIQVLTGVVKRGLQEVRYSGIDDTTVDGRNHDDLIQVLSTSGVPVLIKGSSGLDRIEVGSGDLSTIQAKVTVDGGTNLDRLVISDVNDSADNSGDLVNGKLTGLGLGPDGICYNSFTEDIDIYLGSGSENFLVQSVPKVLTIDTTGTVIYAGAGNDHISVGSRPSVDYGDLNAIQTRLWIRGGTNADGAADKIYVNDRATSNKYHYRLTPTSLTNIPHPEAPARTFAGLNYDGLTEQFRLDGTDGANTFEVSPSFDTRYFIDGNLPAPGTVCPDEGDFLKLDTKTIPAPDRTLQITSRGSGRWYFPVTLLKDVAFQSIEKFNHVDVIAVSADVSTSSASKPTINVYDAETNQLKFSISASSTNGANNPAGTRLAVGDIDGDGLPDIITAAGQNTRADVRVYSGTPQVGVQGSLIATIPAANTYGNSHGHGVYVTAGDVDGDCMPEVILAPEKGAANILIFKNQALVPGQSSLLSTTARSFNAFANMGNYHSGATIAVGNLDGDPDNIMELIVGTGHGVAAQIRTYSLAGPTPILLKTILDPSGSKKGVFVASGDVNGDGRAEIVTGSGISAGSRVRVYNAEGQQLNSFVAFGAASENPNAPLRVTMRDANDDGKADIFVMQGRDGKSNYRLKKFDALSSNLIDSFFASNYDFAGGGVNLG